MSNIYKTPITIIMYNRPNKLRVLIETLRKIKPTNIFVISDGAKENVKDQNLVQECKDLINSIDWEHNLYTNYSEFNLGLRKRVETGLDWVFDNVDYSIILEDDCIPNQNFFEYMSYYLKAFKDSENVYMVTGNNLYTNTSEKVNDDVFFTHSALIWGWGTWSNSWNQYKTNKLIWQNKIIRLKLFIKIFMFNLSIGNVINGYRIFKKVHNDAISTWDYLWTSVVLFNNGYVITPKKNLVKNIGFDSEGTHTFDSSSFKANLKTDEVSIEYKIKLEYNKLFDKYFINDVFGKPNIILYIKKLLKIGV